MYESKKEITNLQPREKAFKYGIKNLSDKELIEILLGSGTSTSPLKTLSKRILKLMDAKNEEVTLIDLMQVNGIGKAKAALLTAAMEYSRRRLHPSIVKVSYPTDILSSVRHYVTRPQEYFIVLSLNGAHEIIKTRIVSIGILNRTLIHPREVFAGPITERAASIIVSHNHPSGNLEPSNEDKEVTKRLEDAGNLLGIKLLDHVIFSNRDHYSFAENGLI